MTTLNHRQRKVLDHHLGTFLIWAERMLKDDSQSFNILDQAILNVKRELDGMTEDEPEAKPAGKAAEPGPVVRPEPLPDHGDWAEARAHATSPQPNPHRKSYWVVAWGRVDQGQEMVTRYAGPFQNARAAAKDAYGMVAEDMTAMRLPKNPRYMTAKAKAEAYEAIKKRHAECCAAKPRD